MRAVGQRPTSFEIRAAKLRDYLLNLDHPVGGPKARFFLAQGFSPERIEALADALTDHALTSSWTEERTAYGINLVFEGALKTPSGKLPRILSVWNEPDRGLPANFVTSYPA